MEGRSEKAVLRARLASARAGLLWQLLGLDENTFTGLPVFDNWTANRLLAHIASWDELFARRIELVLAGRANEIAEIADQRAVPDWPLDRSLDAFLSARAAYLSALARVSDDQMHRTDPVACTDRSILEWTEARWKHDIDHTNDLARWKSHARPPRAVGPKSVLVAALRAARKELLTTQALLPLKDRESQPVSGGRTLKEILSHVADRECRSLQGVREAVEGDGTLTTVPSREMSSNRGTDESPESWSSVWARLHATHQELIRMLEQLDQDDLSRPVTASEGSGATVYDVIAESVGHDREHAAGLRDAVGLWPNQ